jgi:hypothetical protein
MGIVAEILTNNTRRPLWGYRLQVYSILVLGFLSFLVWAHHMFLTGMGTTISAFFQATTLIISIPSDGDLLLVPQGHRPVHARRARPGALPRVAGVHERHLHADVRPGAGGCESAAPGRRRQLRARPGGPVPERPDVVRSRRPRPLPAVANLAWSLRAGRAASGNPWDATTLEWTGASTPPRLHDEFETRPRVVRDPYEYSFALPQMRVKQDAIPGVEQPVWFTPTATGEWEIVCSQLCGLGHYRMRGFYRIQSPEAFETWLAAQAALLDGRQAP